MNIVKKDKCKLCNKPLGTNRHLKSQLQVRVKTDLFGKHFDEVFHDRCWNKFKIYT